VGGDELLAEGAGGRPTVAVPSAVPDFDGWVAAHGSALLRFAYAVVGEQAAAEQVLRTSLARAYERWPQLSRVGDPTPLVRRMIVNSRASWWGRIRRRSRSGHGGMIDLTDAELRDQVPLPDLVWDWCRDLPPRQRAAIVLRLYEGLSYAQIAASLGCAEGAARSDVHRALVVLRLAIEDEQDHDD
jgi:RNA polymerase sigma factor (sigma-70 family)